MAIYHLSMKTVARSKGQSVTAAAAYRAAEKIKDERTGEIFDYSRKKGVIETALILPKDVPKMGRADLWNAAEAAENRKNSTVGREYEIALPAELAATERLRLAKDFAGWLVEKYGVAADVAIHEPNKKGDERNYHAHILTTTRALGREGLGEKTRQLDEKKSGEVEKIREKWEQMCNRELSRKDEKEISRKSLKAQGIDRLPQIHVGAAATAMERSGKNSIRYRRNQAIKELPAYKAQLVELQKALAPATEVTPETPRNAQNAPSLKNVVGLSPDEAEALLRATTAQIAVKPLEEWNSRRAIEKKELEKQVKRSWAEHSAAEEQTPQKRVFERQHTFETRKKDWEQECKKLRWKALDEGSAVKKHDEETWSGQNKIRMEAERLAKEKHPEAVKVLQQDEKRKKAEQEQQREQRKIQRELQRKSRGRGLGR